MRAEDIFLAYVPFSKAREEYDHSYDFYSNTVIADASALRNAVAATPVGQEVPVTVLRDGHKRELTATVKSLDEATQALLALGFILSIGEEIGRCETGSQQPPLALSRVGEGKD